MGWSCRDVAKAAFRLVYESRSGLIALLHRLGLDYHKPNVIPRKLDEEKQKAFIASYEKLLNSLADNEAVLFARWGVGDCELRGLGAASVACGESTNHGMYECWQQLGQPVILRNRWPLR